MKDIGTSSVFELLRFQAEVMEELCKRGVVRTRNNPVDDLAEELFCRAFQWKREGNSARSIDAVAEDGARYQIKACRMTAKNTSRQLSAIRDPRSAISQGRISIFLLVRSLTGISRSSGPLSFLTKLYCSAPNT